MMAATICTSVGILGASYIAALVWGKEWLTKTIGRIMLLYAAFGVLMALLA